MTFDQVKELIVETLCCGSDEVTLEASLNDDLGADSLDAVELNIAIEEAFSIKIPDEDLLGFKTVKDIVDYIDQQGK